MDLDSAQAPVTAIHRRSCRTDTRLYGGWLICSRVVWVVVLVAAVGLFIASIPFIFTDAHTICAPAACNYGSYVTPGQARELQHLGLSVDFYAAIVLMLSIVLEFVYVAVGVVIFWKRSDDRMALLSSLALITFSAAFRGYNPELSLSPLLYVLTLSMAFFGNCCMGFFLYLFPTGRFVPRWTGFFAMCWIVYWGVTNLIMDSIVTNPGFSFIIFLGLLASVVVTQVYRYRRISTSEQRRQTKWVVFGISLALIGFLSLMIVAAIVQLSIIPNLILGSLLYIFLMLIPLSLGVAILHSHLWDIDIIINRTLVYGALTACVVGIYVLIVVGLGTLLQNSGNLLISLLTTGLVALLFQPLRERLQRAVNRLMYGERDTPYRVISRLGQRLEATLAPNEVLPTIVETVAQALKLPYVAITLKQEGEFVRAASYGMSKESLSHLPLVYQNEQMGELLLAPRTSGETFTPADRALLDDLARQTGVAAHAVRLTTDLQRLTGELQQSRTQLVTTREEERRRLRRDLHDGLGSALTSVTFQLDAACNLLDHDPQAVRTLLMELKGQMQASIADIRRLVYNLRPPILDEWGLVAALREQVAQYQLNAVQVTVEAPEPLPALLAAVEVAAYRIALEALANVIRHAQATRCTICLAVCDDALTVEVQDNGKGLPSDYHTGVGISAMRERAAELGGSCVIEDVATGGTRVYAWLPLLKE